jgi:hypothetical protein
MHESYSERWVDSTYLGTLPKPRPAFGPYGRIKRPVLSAWEYPLQCDDCSWTKFEQNHTEPPTPCVHILRATAGRRDAGFMNRHPAGSLVKVDIPFNLMKSGFNPDGPQSLVIQLIVEEEQELLSVLVPTFFVYTESILKAMKLSLTSYPNDQWTHVGFVEPEGIARWDLKEQIVAPLVKAAGEVAYCVNCELRLAEMTTSETFGLTALTIHHFNTRGTCPSCTYTFLGPKV